MRIQHMPLGIQMPLQVRLRSTWRRVASNTPFPITRTIVPCAPPGPATGQVGDGVAGAPGALTGVVEAGCRGLQWWDRLSGDCGLRWGRRFAGERARRWGDSVMAG